MGKRHLVADRMMLWQAWPDIIVPAPSRSSTMMQLTMATDDAVSYVHIGPEA